MKKFKMISLYAIVLTFTCNSFAQEFSLEYENSDAAVELVKTYTKALVQGDINTMNSQLAENAMVYGLGGTDSLTIKEHGDYFKNTMAMDSYKLVNELYMPVKVENSEAYNGDWVLSWGVNIITDKKSKAELSLPYHVVSLVDNGKIQKLYYFYDSIGIMQKRGYTITPPSEN